MRVAVVLIVAFFMGIIAHSKGFRWWLWVLAGGIPGFIILLCLPSAAKDSLDEETVEKRRARGNTVGSIISMIVIMLTVLLIIALAANM